MSRILALTGENPERVENEVMELLRRAFKREFLNRVDDIVMFQNLGREELASIVDIQLRRLEELLAERRVSLEVSQAARRWLADKGYDPAYGARPLKRVISKELKDSLAVKLLEGRTAGAARVSVDVKGDALSFEVEQVENGAR